MNLSILEYINFLQRYVIVHSYIYYHLDTNVISDREYDAKAKELVRYKTDYPDLWRFSMYYNLVMTITDQLALLSITIWTIIKKLL